MQDRHLAVAGSLLLGLVVVGALVAAAGVGLGIDLGVGGDQPAFEESGLASFTATDPACTDAVSDNSSTVVRSAGGGTRISVNDTIAVDARDSRVDADFREVGPGRYVLDVQRHPGDEVADCRLAVRYNATLNLTETTGYTVILTYDDELKGIQWSEPGASGASKSVSAEGPGSARSGGGTGDAGGPDDGSTGGDATGNETTETPALRNPVAG